MAGVPIGWNIFGGTKISPLLIEKDALCCRIIEFDYVRNQQGS